MRLLGTLAALQLMITSVILTPSGDYWGEWNPFGPCSRTCGGGIMIRTRECVTLRTDGGNNCVGPARSQRMCNVKPCPDGSRDFREEQCSQFDGTEFQGRRYKWIPYYGAENPCELNCIPRGENFFYRHRASVVDGTPCHPGRKDICVSGVCKRLGCDNKLDSTQQEDPCLQCGGNGQSCYLVRNSFSQRDMPTGYNRMITIPAGATSIRIRETIATRNYLAIKNLQGEYYLNGHWVIEFSRATPIAGTMLYYQRGAEGDMVPETIIGRGPTTEPLVVELISQEPNQGVEYEYYLPHGRSRQGYYWSHGSWSPCSRDCGTGYQSRHVFCAIDTEVYSDHLCSALPRPASNRTCNTQECPQVHSWRLGEWNQCSVTCGGGSQVRTVQCISHDASGHRVVEDAQCESHAQRPVSQQLCNNQQCAEYRPSAWSQCSVSCGVGEQTREVVCVGSGGARLGDEACGALLKPPHTQPCNMPPCTHHVRWHVADWGLCSKSCGSGLRERQVMCSDSQRNLYGVELCSGHPKPPTTETCNRQPCYSPQEVPSTQDPRGHGNTIHGFQPYVHQDPDPVLRPDAVAPTNTVIDPHGSAIAQHCSQTPYGCCPDRRTAARGPQGQGCPQDTCLDTRYGCCGDGVTAAQGPQREGCAEYSPPPTIATPVVDCKKSTYGCCYDGVTPAEGAYGEGCRNPPTSTQRSATCFLPKSVGTCAEWSARYYYDSAQNHCVHFWYGGCHGNSNKFLSRQECQNYCQLETTGSSVARTTSSSAGGAGRTRDMSHVFTVPTRSAPSIPLRFGSNAATSAYRARLHLRARRPAPSGSAPSYPHSHAQQMMPAAR